MFSSLKNLNVFRRYHLAPALPLSSGALGLVRLPAGAESRQRLFCYWQPNAETRQLECRWEWDLREQRR